MQKIEDLAMDLHNVFQLIIQQDLPHAVIIAEKYHVVHITNEALDPVPHM